MNAGEEQREPTKGGKPIKDVYNTCATSARLAVLRRFKEPLRSPLRYK